MDKYSPNDFEVFLFKCAQLLVDDDEALLTPEERSKFNIITSNEKAFPDDPSRINLMGMHLGESRNPFRLRPKNEQLKIMNQLFCGIGNKIIERKEKAISGVLKKAEDITGQWVDSPVVETIQNYIGNESKVKLLADNQSINIDPSSEVDGGTKRRKKTKKRKNKKRKTKKKILKY